MAAQVYYSVSPFGTGDIKTGTPNCSISSGVATLDVAQTGNIGQGCRLTYGGHIAYISQVNSSTSFNVVTATGGTPDDHASVAVDSIAHEYASLSDAEAGCADANHINNSSLITADVVLNICCYYDHDDYTADTTGYITFNVFATTNTDATRYMHIYTPKGGTQSINNQRHSGKWDANKYYLNIAASYAINNQVRYIWFDGLQSTTSYSSGNVQSFFTNTYTMPQMDISNCIIKSTISDATYYCIGISVVGGNSTNQGRVWNNIIYGFNNGHASSTGITASDAVYIYNNTVYNCHVGISGSYSYPVLKNNICYSNDGGDYSGAVKNTATNNLSSDNTAPAYNTYYRSKTLAFVNTGSGTEDFHLASTDTDAIDHGADLSASFTDDIDGQTRSGTWDIGADEYVAAGGGSAYTASGALSSAGALSRMIHVARTYAGELMEWTKQLFNGWRQYVFNSMAENFSEGR
jgi:hypothetical protein